MIERWLTLGSGLLGEPGYTGAWCVDGHSLEIRTDGTAISDLPGRESGTWNEALERLRIQWQSGAVGLIYRDGASLRYSDFGSGRSAPLVPSRPQVDAGFT